MVWPGRWWFFRWGVYFKWQLRNSGSAMVSNKRHDRNPSTRQHSRNPSLQTDTAYLHLPTFLKTIRTLTSSLTTQQTNSTNAVNDSNVAATLRHHKDFLRRYITNSKETEPLKHTALEKCEGRHQRFRPRAKICCFSPLFAYCLCKAIQLLNRNDNKSPKCGRCRTDTFTLTPFQTSRTNFYLQNTK